MPCPFHGGARIQGAAMRIGEVILLFCGGLLAGIIKERLINDFGFAWIAS